MTHAHLIVSSQYQNLASELVNLYIKFGDFYSSLSVLSSLQIPNTRIWNLMMKNSLDLGKFEMGILIYRKMREIGVEHDTFTLPIINQLFLVLGHDVRFGNMMHCVGIQLGFRFDVYFCNTLIGFYAKCGCISLAHKVFDEMPHRDLVSWTSIVSGYVSERNVVQAFRLFGEMRKDVEPNSVTVITLLQGCNVSVIVVLGKQFHGYILKKGFLNDKSVKNALLQVYSNQGTSEDVEILFSESASDVVTWNILISFYVAIGNTKRVLEIFYDMLRGVAPSVESLTLVASSLSKCGYFSQGQQLHCFAIKANLCDHIFLTCLMDLYAKCNDLESSVQLLSEIPSRSRNSMTWSTLMSGYNKNGHYKMTIELFKQLQSSGVKLESEIMATLLNLCADTGALHMGKEIHAYYIRNFSQRFLEDNSILETSILNMYLKSGSLSSARQCFTLVTKKDVVAWTSMVEGLGMYGLGHEALAYFDQMLKQGIEPTDITFLSALSACSHSGLTNKGCQLLYAMKWIFGIEPELNHYTCIVDLLGRSGKLKSALSVILKMVAFPDSRIWGALLAACRTYMNRNLGEYAAKRILELEPDNVGYHVVLSNMQASAEQWTEVEQLRATATEVNTSKLPGWSCVEANGQVQGFVSGDRTHCLIGEIYELLGFLSRQIKDADFYC